MECCSACFEKTLQFVSPAHGGWGVIRVAALVPECYMLFVSPFACGRHGALGGIINGVKNKVSYLFIDEKDIVSGDYEKQIIPAIQELFEFLPKMPKVLFLFVSCLDDMLGTDHEALNEKISEKFPGLIIRTCHMNPIQSDTSLPPLVSLNRNIYSLLIEKAILWKNSANVSIFSTENETPKKLVKQINLIGNNVLPFKSCELYTLLEKNAFSILHISQFSAFSDYRKMAKSCLNLCLSPLGLFACRDMEKDPKIPFINSFVCYNPTEIKNWYKVLEKKLNSILAEFGEKQTICFDIQKYFENAETALKETAAFIKNTPIAIDFQAVKRPCSLAKTLIEYGFNVKLLAFEKPLPVEKEDFEWLKNNAPHLEIANPLHSDSPKFEYYSYSDCLCIGFDCGYMTGSKHVMNLMEDEGNFGFDGVLNLTKQIKHAFINETNVENLITEAGLVI